MSKEMLKTWFYVGVGVLAAMALENTIGGFVNPILANVKLSI